jgi:tRNA(adenine34) deaminase
MNKHEHFMKLALEEAKKALSLKEVPIGAIIVKNNTLISTGYNLKENTQDVTMHAEIIAIKNACKVFSSWRLCECEMYVTLEPCPMCAGAIIQARIDKLYIGALDPKTGAAGSTLNLFESDKYNHNVDISFGVLENACSKILKDFFCYLRKKHKV